MSDIIKVENLVEVYSDGTKAVDDISFSVKEGEFFGFLGPNGAGKSTTIKILTTLLRKTSGTATVAGYDIEKQAADIRKIIGVQSQDTSVDPELTGRENMMLQGNLQQLRGKELTERVESLLDVVGLKDAADKRASRYSGGMKKRLDLVSALVHKPRLLFLDEPTTGLDPQSRTAIWNHLEELNREEGVTVFLTTQYLEEADRLCRQLAIIDRGKLIAEGTPSELKERVGGDAITLSLDGSDRPKTPTLREALSVIQGVTSVVDSKEGIRVYAKNAGRIVVDVAAALQHNRLRPTSVNVSSCTMDDVFLQLTGRRIRQEELGRKETEPFLM